MDKEVLKEIFLLILEIFKALIELLWDKTKSIARFIWNRFFGKAEVSLEEEAEVKEWGVTGEDKWPHIQDISQSEEKETLKQKEDKKVFFPAKISELPDNYGDNRFVLMVRDPLCLFGYWEIQQGKIDNFLNSLYTLAYDARFTLRLYDITNLIFDGKNANSYMDIEITGGAQSWYIHVNEPDKNFCADLGFFTSDGIYHTLIRSNTVATSRLGPSEIVDEQWVAVGAVYEKLYEHIDIEIYKPVFERTYEEWLKLYPETISSPKTSQ